MRAPAARLIFSSLAVMLPLLLSPPVLGDDEQTFGGPLLTRPKLTGDWGGARDALAEKGFTFDLDLTYIFQGVAGGGLDGPLFKQFSDESDLGNTFGADFKFDLDTERAGLWSGGFFTARLQARAGRSIVQRAGTVAPVNNLAVIPNVVNDFDEGAIAVTDLSFTQYFGEKFALFAGLLNTGEGDANDLAGSSLSNAHFLNNGLLYSLVENATSPNVALGGGILFDPTESISGSFSIFGTEEAAGENPFDHLHGTTFSTEWTVHHQLRERPGAQTVGFLYGINAVRTDIAADPRTVLASVLAGHAVPTTSADTWAFYYNGYQCLVGDVDRGWGVFLRFGLSDGDPNPVKWNVAGGLAGKGLLPQREQDNWGVGVFYLDLSDQDLLKGLHVSDEVGGEAFYNFAITPWCHVTLDAQVIDSALPRAGTVWVLGVRTNFNL